MSGKCFPAGLFSHTPPQEDNLGGIQSRVGQKLSMARSGATHPPKPLNMNGHTRYRLSRDMGQHEKLYKQISERKMVFLKPSQTSDCSKGWFERFGFGFLFGQIVDESCFTKRRRNELYT